jgi:hypothetical protein
VFLSADFGDERRFVAIRIADLKFQISEPSFARIARRDANFGKRCRRGIFVDLRFSKIPSSVRSGIVCGRSEYVAPMGLWGLGIDSYKDAAPTELGGVASRFGRRA